MKASIKSIVLPLLVGLAAACQAQVIIGDPNNPVDPPPKPKVTTDIRFAPLVKGEVVQLQRGGGYIRQVSKEIKCTFDPANLPNNYTILHYHWSGLDFGATPPDSATATGVAHNTGGISVSCEVEVVPIGYTNHMTFGPYTSKPVYVVGGPLSLGVQGGYTGTPVQDPPASANAKAGPYYVEYFNFDPTGQAPQGAQAPQNGTVSAYGLQPGTTTYKWTVAGQLKRMDTGGVTASTISVCATAGSGGSPIPVKCTYQFDNKSTTDPVTGTCDDDSLATPDPDGLLNPARYNFDSHLPDHMEFVSSTPLVTIPLYSSKQSFTYQLHDDGGAIMGYVYIVERFNTNQPGNRAASLWPPNAAGTIVDSLWMDPVSVPHPHTGPPVFSFAHYYYAASTDTSNNGIAVSGILVLQTTSKIWTDFISNDPYKPNP